METKILFLDIDGVLATEDCFKTNKFAISEKLNIPYQWNKEACAALNLIEDVTNCKIVLSSDWRLYYSLDEIKEFFYYYNLPFNSILGFTDNFRTFSDFEGSRNKEINKWVQQHRIDKWCVVDDMSLNVANFVHITDTFKGLDNQDIIHKIMDYLK